MQKRIYKKGRPTTGWQRGKLVRKLSEIKIGDVLIAVGDQFGTENLVKVVPQPKGWIKISTSPKVNIAYARPSGRIWGKTDGNDGFIMCLWDFELKTKRSDGRHRYFKAIKTDSL